MDIFVDRKTFGKTEFVVLYLKMNKCIFVMISRIFIVVFKLNLRYTIVKSFLVVIGFFFTTNAQRRRCNQMRCNNKIKPLLVSKERENGIASKAMTLPKNNNIASDIH